MLFFQLSKLCLLSPLLLDGKFPLVFHLQQSPGPHPTMVQSRHHFSGLFSRGKIRKRQSSKAIFDEVKAEGGRGRKA